jgi:hypothetical protein
VLGEIKLLPSRFALSFVKETSPVTVRVLNGEYILWYIIVTFCVTSRKETSIFVEKKFTTISMLQECYFDRQSGVKNTENHQRRVKLNAHGY